MFETRTQQQQHPTPPNSIPPNHTLCFVPAQTPTMLITRAALEVFLLDARGLAAGTDDDFEGIYIDRIVLEGELEHVFSFFGHCLLTLGNAGTQRQKMHYHDNGIVICSSPHYLLIQNQFKERLGDEVTAFFGIERMQAEVATLMWAPPHKTMLSGDLRKILERIGCNYCTLVTFAMKATVLTARSILHPAFVYQLAYAEIDVGFERQPFIIPPRTLNDEIVHVPLAHRAEDWRTTFLAFCLPKAYPLFIPWQHMLECCHMFGGFEAKIRVHQPPGRLRSPILKVKGYAKIVHLWKSATESAPATIPSKVISMKNSLDYAERIFRVYVSQPKAAATWRCEVSIQIQGIELENPAANPFDHAIHNVFLFQDKVHCRGVLYYQLPLLLVAAMTGMIKQFCQRTFIGLRNEDSPTEAMKLKYCALYSNLGVYSNGLNTYLFYEDSEPLREFISEVIAYCLRRFIGFLPQNHYFTLPPDSDNEVEHDVAEDRFDFWRDTWANQSPNEDVHLLKFNFILEQGVPGNCDEDDLVEQHRARAIIFGEEADDDGAIIPADAPPQQQIVLHANEIGDFGFGV
jgi:hypothetical protein